MAMISLIIPIYNSEQYLEQCLDSIQNQTFSDFETILVNDGSTDGSEGICQRYAAGDSRFRLISIPNRGAAGARNVGLEASVGEYIAFTDSDDWLEPDYLSYLYSGLNQTHADIFFCDFFINGQAEHEWKETQFSGRQAVCELVTGGCCNRIPNKLYRRSVVSGTQFPLGRNLCEDAAWTPLVLEKANIVARGAEAKYHIRLTENSISRHKQHTESQVGAYYRNLLERCIVLMRQYEKQNVYREAILTECSRCLTLVLESGCNLELWDVYPTAKALCQNNKKTFEEKGITLGRFFLQSDGGRECERNYLRHVLFNKPLPVKSKVIKKRLLAIIRRMRSCHGRGGALSS